MKLRNNYEHLLIMMLKDSDFFLWNGLVKVIPETRRVQ